MLVLLLILMVILITRFYFKEKITDQITNDGLKDVEIMVPLKYLSNFWSTLEMLLINYKINRIPTWAANCVISSHTALNQASKFVIGFIKLHVLVVALLTDDNAKLLQQWKSGIKRTINWNTYQPKQNYRYKANI